MNRLKYILQHRYYIKIIAIFVVILSLVYINTSKRTSIYHNETSFVGIVTKIKLKNNKTTIYLHSKEDLIIQYHEEVSNINLGDKVSISGSLTKPSNNTIPGVFNYKEYLMNEGIFYIVKASSISKIANNTSIIYLIRTKISNYISKISHHKEYLSIFILGDNTSLDDQLIKSYQRNGISHLFSISGMHISLFAALLLSVLKRLSYNNYYNYSLVVIFLSLYSILIGKKVSAIRSLIMYILFIINKLFNLKTSKINLVLLVLIIMLIYNPYYLRNVSFQYSYLISFTLILFSKRSNQYHGIFKYLFISWTAFLISFPLTIYNSFEINPLSIILNTFMVPLISFIIFPLALITFIFPKISFILSLLIKIVENISLLISNHKIGLIIFPKPSFLIILIYYFFIYLFLYNSKYFYIFILIFVHKLFPYLDYSTKILFLDVGQGDSIIIKTPFNKNNILIDTGGNNSSDYSIVINRTIPYLKSQGLNHLDYLIITHGDADHCGEAINLVNNFKVEKVIFNCGEYNDLEKELIKALDKKNIKNYSCIKELKIDKNKLYFLQTKVYGNENDNSNVIYTELNGYKFMFMGDASTTTEKEILSKYNLPDIDVLKVGHHGSKTSSGIDFINEINPKYSIISVGKKNHYGHPNKEALNNLKYSKIYRTDEDGSIMLKIKNNKLKIETCSP